MITTGNTIVSIYTEMTPNPETMKFVANKLLYPGKSIDFPDEEIDFLENKKIESVFYDVMAQLKKIQQSATIHCALDFY